ncbi:MAG: hypothetical protein EXS16_14315 [Gemmataceae bacterium]|nr:hypothetical protein [Gemmataceae bacterium]
MLLSILSSIWKWTVASLVPFKPNRLLTPVVRWIIWIVLDLLFFGLLFIINDVAEIAPIVQRTPFQTAWLRHFFLPILGQLVVFLGIVLYWFYRQWFAELDDSMFPDIDTAWQEATQGLGREGIHLPRVPLFLVVGQTLSAQDHLFEALDVKPVFRRLPADPDAPISVFFAGANDPVYVTCRGASVLARLAQILSVEELVDSPVAQDTDVGEALGVMTLHPGVKQQDVVLALHASMQNATPIRKRFLRRAAIMKPLGEDFVSNLTEIDRCKARLAHLCRLIARDRQPFCGANGILLLIPLGGTDTLGEAQFTAQAVQEDLSVVRQELKLDCPLVTLLVDMEQLPGFTEFMQRQSPKDLYNRCGANYPMSSRLSREETLEQIRRVLSWVCTTYLQDSVSRLFKVETQTEKNSKQFAAGNAQLVLLLDEMNQRADSLDAIVQQAIAPKNEPLFRFSGCYMAATGNKGSQAFLAGVFQKLVKEQSSVSWTEAALAEDARCQTWAGYYRLLSSALFLVCLAIVGLIIYRLT